MGKFHGVISGGFQSKIRVLLCKEIQGFIFMHDVLQNRGVFFNNVNACGKNGCWHCFSLRSDRKIVDLNCLVLSVIDGIVTSVFSCPSCGGRGVIPCETCCGRGHLKWYIKLEVTW